MAPIAPADLPQPEPKPGPARRSVPGLRWWICGLLFFATTLNYLDRQSLSVLKEEFLTKDLNWRESDYSWILFSFQTAYALFQPFVGRLIDSIGVRASFAIAVVLWSLMAGAHAMVRSTIGFCVVRFFLGMAESANFPASIKAVAQWYPQKERALATGIFNSGSNVGIMLAPFTVWLAATFGWRAAFVAIGAIGFVWLIFWLKYYNSPETHDRLSQKESEYIRAGLPAEVESVKIPWTALLRQKEVWPFLIAKFLTDPVWWFYLFWIPIYLNDVRHFTAPERATALTLIYAISSAGALLGGAASSFLMKRGWDVGRARKSVMLICACIMPVASMGVFAEKAALTVLLFGISMAAHAAWMTNVFTTTADVFPKEAVGVANGFGNCVGGLGGALFSGLIPGFVIPLAGYVPVLLTMSCFYLLALLLVHKLMGNLEPVVLEKP